MEMLPSLSSTDNVPGKDEKRIKRFTFMSFKVLVGMNALSNEKLISEHEHPRCLWFHAQGASGAHVILCLGNEGFNSDLHGVDNAARRYAASLAIKFSDRSSKKVSVAPLEDVYKPQHSRVGVFRTWRQEVIEII
jgi:predicted ribosome quality control (RQC) complex YloA/Tae2 family protein